MGWTMKTGSRATARRMALSGEAGFWRIVESYGERNSQPSQCTSDCANRQFRCSANKGVAKVWRESNRTKPAHQHWVHTQCLRSTDLHLVCLSSQNVPNWPMFAGATARPMTVRSQMYCCFTERIALLYYLVSRLVSLLYVQTPKSSQQSLASLPLLVAP